jgi:hypothetical protein
MPSRFSQESTSGRSADFYVFLVDGWSDARAHSAVSRFWHSNQYVDAIYLPSDAPTALGFIEALRALEHDRVVRRDSSHMNRTIILGSAGSQDFYKGGVFVRALPLSFVTPAANLGVIDAQLRRQLMPLLAKAAKHPSKKMNGVRLVKYHQ